MKLGELPLYTVIVTQEGKRLRVIEHESESTILELVGPGAVRISMPSERQFNFHLESKLPSQVVKPRVVFYRRGYNKAVCEALLAGAETLSDIIDKAYQKEFGDRRTFADRVMSQLHKLKINGVIKKVGNNWKLLDRNLLQYEGEKK